LLKVKKGDPDSIGINHRNTLSILRIKICSLTQRLGKKAISEWTLVRRFIALKRIEWNA